MEAFEVRMNGDRLCLAGVADGVLSVTINCVGSPERERHFFLSVGGLDSASDEHVRWLVPGIGVGAEVLVRVVEADAVDPPGSGNGPIGPARWSSFASTCVASASR